MQLTDVSAEGPASACKKCIFPWKRVTFCCCFSFSMACLNTQEKVRAQVTKSHPSPHSHPVHSELQEDMELCLQLQLVSPPHAGQVLPSFPNPKPQVFNDTSLGLLSTWGYFFLCRMIVLTIPSNPLENVKEWCRLVPDPSSAGGNSENWEGRSGKWLCHGQHQHSLRDFCHGL